MRKLVWFTIGFGAACGIFAYRLDPEWLLFPAFLAAGICICYARKKPFFQMLCLLMGILTGAIWFQLFEVWYLEPIYGMDGIMQYTDIRCSSYAEQTDYGNQVTGTVIIREKQYPVRIYLERKLQPEPGTVLSGNFLFKVTAPGGLKESTYHQGEGIFLLAYPQKEPVLLQTDRLLQDLPAIFRQKLLSMLDRNLPDGGYPFAKALLLGDSSGLDYAVLTDLTVSGVRHIVAVSGLHVSILFALLGFITLHKRYLGALLGIPALVIFAAVTGLSPSVCRACLMSGLMLLAPVLNREYDGPSALAFAGLVLLMINPLGITSVSYQLSFASVAGIFAFSPSIRGKLLKVLSVENKRRKGSRLISGVILSVSVTLGATVASMPLCAVYFGTVSLTAVLTNLLVLWAVSAIFYGLLAMCLTGLFWTEAGMFFGKIITGLIRYVLLTAEMIANFPLAAVYTKSPYIVVWILFVYLLLLVFLVCKNRKSRELTCCLVLGLCCALLASWTESARWDVRFTVLDVGQGQCLLLQTEGRSYLVDCGGSSDAIAADAAAKTLLSQGIAGLDGLILTHFDQDHAGGVENLLSRIAVDTLILPPEYSGLQLSANRILYAYEDLLLSSDSSQIHIYASENGGSRNENSLCILFDTENCDILITGDRNFAGEHSLLQRAQIENVDVLVAGHHGAENSTGEELLAAVQPEIVCISAGEGNIYRHPHPALLRRLEEHGCTVYRTDLQGDILIRR